MGKIIKNLAKPYNRFFLLYRKQLLALVGFSS
jgi:hypothetical protein